MIGRRAHWWIAPSLTLLAYGHGVAAAQPAPARLRLVVQAKGLDAAAIRRGLEDDLGASVSTGAGERPRTLWIVRSAAGQVELRYREPTIERRRLAELPRDPSLWVEAVVLMAANLVRDPSAGLVAPGTAAQREASRSVAGPSDEASPPEATARSIDVGAPDAPQASSEDGSFAVTNQWRLGASVMGGAAATPAGAEAFAYWGLDLGYTVHPMVSLGISRLSFMVGAWGTDTSDGTTIQGVGFALQLTPHVELFTFPDRHVQIYAQLGAALQGRTTTDTEGWFQVAPFLGGGARFFVADWFSIDAEIGLHLVATEAYLMGATELPQATVSGTVGLGVSFHLR